MPLVYQQNINLDTRLGVWHITEAENFFLKKVNLQADITHRHKRLQHLAGRFLLQELYPAFPLQMILVAETRKPFLPEEEYHFSISHCGDYAAAIVSSANRVGTDIEIPQEKIQRIRHKFLSHQESAAAEKLPLNLLQQLTLLWSIKEAVFKWYGAGQVDFREHININSLIHQNGRYIAACYFTKHTKEKINVQGIFFKGNCLTWLVT